MGGTSSTPNLELTEISESDSEAADQFNDSFLSLDALVQCSVISRSVTAAPLTADQGDRYIVPTTGVLSADPWFGHARQIAYRTATGWSYKTPRPGWRAHIQDESSGSPAKITTAVYLATSWQTEDSPSSILTTKGDIIGFQHDEPGRLVVGADGKFLHANSAAALGIDWAYLVASKGGIPCFDGAELVGADGQILTARPSMTHGVNWEDPAGGGGGGGGAGTPIFTCTNQGAGRVANTVYQNTSGFLMIIAGFVAATVAVDTASTPTAVPYNSQGYNGASFGFFIVCVPSGYYYKTTATPGNWFEFTFNTGTHSDSGDLTGSRAFSTVYQNTGSGMKIVTCGYGSGSGGNAIGAFCGPTSTPQGSSVNNNAGSPNRVAYNTSQSGNNSVWFLVPPGYYYTVQRSGSGTLNYWHEVTTSYTPTVSPNYGIDSLNAGYVLNTKFNSVGTNGKIILAVMQESTTGTFLVSETGPTDDTGLVSHPGQTNSPAWSHSANGSTGQEVVFLAPTNYLYSMSHDSGVTPQMYDWTEYTF